MKKNEKKMYLIVRGLDLAEKRYNLYYLKDVADVDYSIVYNKNFKPFEVAEIFPLLCFLKGEVEIG